MKNLIVNKKYNNTNISKVILKAFPNLSKNSLYKLFRLKDIKVNGKRIKEDIIVFYQDKIEIYADDNTLLGIPKSVLYYYEDENILVAYKPKGIISNTETESFILSTDSFNNSNNITFEDIVKKDKIKNCDSISICHRLDTNTEGLVIFSKNDIANTEILNAFRNGYIHKKYICFVSGYFDKKHDILKGYIVKDSKTSYSKISDKNLPGSKPVITEYTVLKYLPEKNISILEIDLHTGRTHQIRAHMKFIGHPVIGDSKYGSNEINKKLGQKSQLLFASKYTFDFPQESVLHYLNDIHINIDIDKLLSRF